ncbi:MAG: type II secretion system GspH family protein [Lachnospiraceae bacterium]|nr:type II secretion system GspH family protein [Lachnospiraceae bacterium]
MLANRKKSMDGGFTLIEIIVTLTIIAVLAAIIVPSIIAYLNHGKQINRMNIARTIYLAAQNQLTQSKTEKNLMATLTAKYYEEDAYGRTVIDRAITRENNVAAKLGSNFPVADRENKDYVHYISKPSGARPADGYSDVELERFYQILDAIIVDKSVLNGAILMEYNVETGVVMSIFYSDTLEVGKELRYDTGDGVRGSVMGARGMGASGYSYAGLRRQGYYGVEMTGSAMPPKLPGVVHILDGYEKALDGNENVLYAEYILPPECKETFHFKLVADKGGATLLEVEEVMLATVEEQGNKSLKATIDLLTLMDEGAPLIYNAGNAIEEKSIVKNGVDLSAVYAQAGYVRYVWVMDYLADDILVKQPFSIGKQDISPTEVRATAVGADGVLLSSFQTANTHFARRMRENLYEVRTVRHLNNIRYAAPDNIYRQTADIAMQYEAAEYNITNFPPIQFTDETGAAIPFSGGYFARKEISSGWQIQDLVMDTTKGVKGLYPNVGLFAMLGTSEESTAKIEGLSLFRGSIVAEDSKNVGSIAGLLDGGSIGQSYSYVNIETKGATNTGGMVGVISDGVLELSWNAGFYDTYVATDVGIGSVLADGGNIGGLVGRVEALGSVRNSYNNARVNIKDVVLTEDALFLSKEPTPYEVKSIEAIYLGGIVGANRGTIMGTYHTNFVGIYENNQVASGGIAGVNHGMVANSFYISNGCEDAGGVSKEELQENETILRDLGSAFEKGGIYQEGLHTYGDYYPYPVLVANNPILEVGAWGWEDIEAGEKESLDFFYYEVYDGGSNTVGYSYIGSGMQLEEPILNTDTAMVIHDGYGIALSENRVGYRIQFINESSGFNQTVVLYPERLSVNQGVWQVVIINSEADTAQIEQNWPVQETKDIEGNTYYRLYIPNAFTAKETAVSLLVYRDGARTIQEEDAPIGRGSYYPLFALSSNGLSNGIIRSPRHLDNIDVMPAGRYIQQLHLNLARYDTGMAVNTGGQVLSQMDEDYVLGYRLANANAVITVPFTGTYNGNGKWIENVRIHTSQSNAGLFAENRGVNTIQNITLRNPRVVGTNHVGTIAGSNSGVIRNCFVQCVSDMSQDFANHSIMVSGTNNVGGVVGNNSGTIVDVAVVSTSAKPAVQGVSNVGGIVGATGGGEVNRVMYLAVAPVTDGIHAQHKPYAGTGTVGVNKYYLSGNKALRPFGTWLDGMLYSDYNSHLLLHANPEPGNRSTLDLVRAQRFVGWNMTALTDGQVISQSNEIYPYPYPSGTVPPNAFEWPLADEMKMDRSVDAVVYYELYDTNGDGIGDTYGVFTRRFDESTADPNDYIELDYLNYNGVIVETGYGFIMPSAASRSGNKRIWSASAINGTTFGGWTQREQNFQWDSQGANSIFTVPNLDMEFLKIANVVSWHNLENANKPLEPYVIWIGQSNGNTMNPPAGVAYINPLFAKEVYPIRLVDPANSTAISSAPHAPKEHGIRTPWQMQNIFRATGTTNTTGGHTFVQEADLNFRTTITTATGDTRRVYPVINTGNASMTNLGMVYPANTSNIVSGTFHGIYDGNGKVISNLSLSAPTTNNKGLFHTIGTAGVVKNVSLEHFSIANGNGNGTLAAVNNGNMQDVLVLKTGVTAPVTGTGSNLGGVIGNNTGGMERILYLAPAPNQNPIVALNTGTITDAYYLSGTVSIYNRPSGSGDTGVYNDFVAAYGKRQTTQEINDLNWTNGFWRGVEVSSVRNTYMAATYPYMYMGAYRPASWPVATRPALVLAYYEIYDDGADGEVMGFFIAEEQEVLPALREDLPIEKVGYCAIVSIEGTYSVKRVSENQNKRVVAKEIVGTDMYYVTLPEYVLGFADFAEIQVNDQPVADGINSNLLFSVPFSAPVPILAVVEQVSASAPAAVQTSVSEEVFMSEQTSPQIQGPIEWENKTEAERSILVYYEVYEDDKMGFYTLDEAVTLDALLDDEKNPIVKAGYGIWNSKDGFREIEAKPVKEFTLQEVRLQDGTVLGKIYPNFAKGVYAADAADAEDVGDIFIIRTVSQMINISLLHEADEIGDKIFMQEREFEKEFDFSDVPLMREIDAELINEAFLKEYGMNEEAIKERKEGVRIYEMLSYTER